SRLMHAGSKACNLTLVTVFAGIRYAHNEIETYYVFTSELFASYFESERVLALTRAHSLRASGRTLTRDRLFGVATIKRFGESNLVINRIKLPEKYKENFDVSSEDPFNGIRSGRNCCRRMSNERTSLNLRCCTMQKCVSMIHLNQSLTRRQIRVMYAKHLGEIQGVKHGNRFNNISLLTTKDSKIQQEKEPFEQFLTKLKSNFKTTLQQVCSIQVQGVISPLATKITSTQQHELLKGYDELFTGLGCLPGEHTIELDRSYTTVVHPPRRVPLALKEQIKAELQRMEDAGVIAKQTEPAK
ncbi:Hypothetical predicted protein, partial [Paramuricea clavata]